jgi:hypothetical protein
MVFNGQLKNDSPALLHTVKRRFGESASQEIEAFYSFAFPFLAHNKLDEERMHNSSFNPESARIAQIVLSEYPQPSLEQIHLSIISCCDLELFISNRNTHHNLISKARVILNCRKSPDTSQISHDLLSVTLAIELDFLRHLHMQELSTLNISKQIESSLLFLNSINITQENSRLLSLNLHAIERLRKISTINDAHP